MASGNADMNNKNSDTETPCGLAGRTAEAAITTAAINAAAIIVLLGFRLRFLRVFFSSELSSSSPFEEEAVDEEEEGGCGGRAKGVQMPMSSKAVQVELPLHRPDPVQIGGPTASV